MPVIFQRIIKKVQELYSNNSFNQNISAWQEKYNQEDKKGTRLTIIVCVLGILLFLGTAILLPFKNRLFNLLYPKNPSMASYCDGRSHLSSEKRGFVYTGGDLNEQKQALNTALYYTHDASIASDKQIYMVGKYAVNYADPLGLNLLMSDNLSNTEFRGLGGQSPGGWTILTAGKSGSATIDTAKDNVLDNQTSVKITNHKSPSGTQINQSFKESVKEGDLVIFGTWVKTQTPDTVKFFLQENKDPYKEFGIISTPIKAGKWNFIVGFGKVPSGVTNFQLVLRVTGQEQTAWFVRPVAVVINAKPNNKLSELVSKRCGSVWIIDNEPGADTKVSPYIMESISAEIYALVYHQLNQAIKEVDPAAYILPAGSTWTPSSLDAWRAAYKGFFNTEPPLDALNIHYLATDSSRWSNVSDLETYLGRLKTYTAAIPEWQDKPIWITQLGVSTQAPNEGRDFVDSAMNFLEKNNLNVAKWFWFDTCGYDPALSSLFESKNRICSWPAKLTLLGKNYSVSKTSSVSSLEPVSISTPSVTIPALASQKPLVLPSLTPVPTASSSGRILKTIPMQNQASPSAQ